MRAQVSLRLDGELSQLELRMLDAHLARCAECREYDADVTRITTELRAAPLERMEIPVVIRRPRRISGAPAAGERRRGDGRRGARAASQLATRQNEPAFASPERYPMSSQLTREVNQIIADGRAFGDVSGSALPL